MIQIRQVATKRTPRRPTHARSLLASLSIGLALVASTWQNAARSEDLHSPDGATEVWMSGKDIKLARRVTHDRGPAQLQDDDELARTMMAIAQQQSVEGDEETAKWLSQWAHKLTSGRVGVEESSELLVREIDVDTSPDLEPAATASTLQWAQRELTAEFSHNLPQSTMRQEMPTGEHAFEESNWTAEPQASDDNLGPETPGDFQTAELIAPAEYPPRDSLPAREQVAEQSERQISATPPINHYAERAISLLHAPQTEVTLGPIAIAFVSFASGAVFCGALCVVLAFVLVRFRVERPARQRPAPALESTESTKTEPSRDSAGTERPRPTAAVTERRDKTGSIMEAFYHNNIELYEQLAHSA